MSHNGDAVERIAHRLLFCSFASFFFFLLFLSLVCRQFFFLFFIFFFYHRGNLFRGGDENVDDLNCLNWAVYFLILLLFRIAILKKKHFNLTISTDLKIKTFYFFTYFPFCFVDLLSRLTAAAIVGSTSSSLLEHPLPAIRSLRNRI